MKKIFSFLICLFILTGCTSPTQFYIRNFLSVPIEVILVNNKLSKSNSPLLYNNSLEEPSYNDYKYMKQRANYKIIEDSIIFMMLPKSTVSLGFGFAGELYGLKSIIYNTPNSHYIILNSFEDYKNYFNYKSSLIGAYTFWLDIK